MPECHCAQTDAALFQEPAPGDMLRVGISVQVILAIHDSAPRLLFGNGLVDVQQSAGSQGSGACQEQRFVERGQRLKRGVRTPSANTGGVPVGSVEDLQRGVRYGTITEGINGAPVAALTVGFIPGLLRETRWRHE